MHCLLFSTVIVSITQHSYRHINKYKTIVNSTVASTYRRRHRRSQDFFLGCTFFPEKVFLVVALKR